jgi:hypothetical protein
VLGASVGNTVGEGAAQWVTEGQVRLSSLTANFGMNLVTGGVGVVYGHALTLARGLKDTAATLARSAVAGAVEANVEQAAETLADTHDLKQAGRALTNPGTALVGGAFGAASFTIGRAAAQFTPKARPSARSPSTAAGPSPVPAESPATGAVWPTPVYRSAGSGNDGKQPPTSSQSRAPIVTTEWDLFHSEDARPPGVTHSGFPESRFDPTQPRADLDNHIGRGGRESARVEFPGGASNLIEGHGHYWVGNRGGDPVFVVPEGSALTLLRPGVSMSDEFAVGMHRGEWDGVGPLMEWKQRLDAENRVPHPDSPALLSLEAGLYHGIEPTFFGAFTALPGARLPDIQVSAPERLVIASRSYTLAPGDERPLSQLVPPNAGHVSLAACTRVSERGSGEPVNLQRGYQMLNDEDLDLDLLGHYMKDPHTGAWRPDPHSEWLYLGREAPLADAPFPTPMTALAMPATVATPLRPPVLKPAPPLDASMVDLRLLDYAQDNLARCNDEIARIEAYGAVTPELKQRLQELQEQRSSLQSNVDAYEVALCRKPSTFAGYGRLDEQPWFSKDLLVMQLYRAPRKLLESSPALQATAETLQTARAQLAQLRTHREALVATGAPDADMKREIKRIQGIEEHVGKILRQWERDLRP